MVGDLEHVGAAAVAGEEQGARGALRAEGLCLCAERLAQVLVGRGGVPDLEADGLTDPNLLADRDRARLAVRADDRPDQEVAPLVLGPVLVDDDPDQDSRGGQLALVLRERGDHLAQALHRGLSGELADHVRLGAR